LQLNGSKVFNQEDFVRPRRRGPFTEDAVRGLLNKVDIGPDSLSATHLQKDEWWPEDLAEAVGIPLWKMEDWANRGWAYCRHTLGRRWRILWADAKELKRLKTLQLRSRQGRKYPAELTTPRRRKDE
jgi:hypothetical protein